MQRIEHHSDTRRFESITVAAPVKEPPLLSIVLPTKDERGNVRSLITRLITACHDLSFELVFVDDSSDDTARVAAAVCREYALPTQIIVRPEHRRPSGLSGAVLEGISIARGEWICVMDADLQHPPEVVPRLLNHARQNGADVVVGSRFVDKRRPPGLGRFRFMLSTALIAAVRLLFPRQLAKLSDPLSGLFVIRRAVALDATIRPIGFKILLDLLVRNPGLRLAELPVRFAQRYSGRSKASLAEALRFLRQLAQLRLGSDPAFVRFLAVGASGVVVNTTALAAFTELAGLHYLISAVFATQVSTLWNFTLTDAWVFAGRRGLGMSWGRFARYWAVNNLAFAVRGPLLSLLVSGLGLHYAFANLISIFALTLVRFALADRWIWKPARQASGSEQFHYWYDIHGIIRVASMFRLPELEYFQVAGLERAPDIRVRIERRRTARPSQDTVRYAEWPGRYGFEVSVRYGSIVEIAVSSILMRSPHVLYTNVVEPILRWTFVRKGYALAHAGCISFGDRAAIVTAATDTGKTTTILRMLSEDFCRFLSDDMTIVARDGRVLSYPKPLTISLHTLRAVDTAQLTLRERLALQIQSRLHSRQGRLIGLLLGRSSFPAATLNALVQLLVPLPKFMVRKLVPNASISDTASLSRTVVIERGPEHEEGLEHDQAVDLLIRNAEDAYGFPPYPKLAGFLSTWQGQDLRQAERDIIRQALKGRRTTRLLDPEYNWWKRVPSLVLVPH